MNVLDMAHHRAYAVALIFSQDQDLEELWPLILTVPRIVRPRYPLESIQE
jgi:hypothetical protein